MESVTIKSEEAPVTLYACAICNRNFTNAKFRDNHQNVHGRRRRLNGETSTNNCKVCRRKFSDSSELAEHEKIHFDKSRQYECQECHSRFKRLGHLERHMRTHTGARPYKCKLCDQTYPFSYNLHRHMRTHTGERPYQCPKCFKTFLSSHECLRHRRGCKEAELVVECDTSHNDTPETSDLADLSHLSQGLVVLPNFTALD